MVYVGQSLETRRWGYQIIENNDGAMRILEEEYFFNAPGEVFNFIELMKRGTFRSSRDPETRSYGFTILMENTQPMEKFGFDTSEDVTTYITDLKMAINEGVKMKPDVFSKATQMRFS